VTAGPPRGPADLRLVSWNIRAGIGPGEPFPPAWWRHVRPERLESIAVFLRSLEPDVVALQEVAVFNADGLGVDEPALFAARTGLDVRYGAVHGYPLIEPDGGSAIGASSWGNAILSREPLREVVVRGLPRAGDDDLVEPAGSGLPLAGVRYGDAEPGHRERRCVVGGRAGAVGIATAHLTYIGREQRRRQVEALVEIVGERLADGPLIVAGDFNAAAGSDELAPLGASFDDAFSCVGVPPDDPRRRSCGPLAIDHVFVRGLEVVACRIGTEADDRSDHWPVVVDLRLPGAG
jgi:endonuclease/exonuclease/phosphatase family metal-dependent hydrolase